MRLEEAPAATLDFWKAYIITKPWQMLTKQAMRRGGWQRADGASRDGTAGGASADVLLPG